MPGYLVAPSSLVASGVAFLPTSEISSSTVQSAIEEVNNEKADKNLELLLMMEI